MERTRERKRRIPPATQITRNQINSRAIVTPMPIVRRPVDHQCELCQAPIPAGTIHAGPDPLDPGFVVQCPQCCGLELPPAEPEEQTPIQMGLLA